MTRRLVAVWVALHLVLAAVGPALAAAGGASGVVTTSVGVVPFRVAVELSPAFAPTGVPAHVRATISNLGRLTLVEIALTIRTPPGIVVVGSATQRLRDLRPGREGAVTWKLCPRVTGNAVLMVEAAAVDTAGRAWAGTSSAVVLVVQPGSKSC